MESIYAAVRQLIDQGYNPADAADQVLSSTRKVDLIGFVRPIVVDVGTRYRRNNTREVEEEVERLVRGGEDRRTAMKLLLQEEFIVPGVGMVAWLDATVDHHRARAVFMRGRAASEIADAERHEAAADLIEAAGATCLREIEGDAEVRGAA